MRSSGGGHSPGMAAPETSTYTVPGAAAPVSNILRIWHPLLRWILDARTTFATFLHSVKCNKPSEEEGTARTIWPMPPPYPRRMGFAEADSGSSNYKVIAVEKALNLVILMLSWLHLHQPAVAPRTLRLGRTLTRAQWRVVRRLRPFVEEVGDFGDVGPAEMGRTASKMEGLDGQLASLHDFAASRGLAGSFGGYVGRGFLRKPSDQVDMKPGAELDAGEVVGSYKGADLILAKEIEPERLSFPADRPNFKPEKYFDDVHLQCYEDPASLADIDAFAQLEPPRVQIRASRQHSKDLLRFLDRHHRLALTPAEKIDKRLCCGAFALIKDASKDRLIVDARPANLVEPTLTSWCETLGAVSSLLQIELLLNHHLYMSGTDLRDYYYCFCVEEKRWLRNSLLLQVSQSFARELSCFDPDVHDAMPLLPCLKTLAMGDNNAVELGQMAHVNPGIAARAFDASELLTSHSRGPRGLVSAGVVIDDVLIAEQLAPEAADSVSEGEYRLNSLFELYQTEGLTPHPGKTFKKALTAEVWGASIDGARGWCRSSLKRLIPLIDITSRTARLGVATVHLLEIIAGAWVAILQVRRRMLSLLQHIYTAQIGRQRSDIVRLSPPLIVELWSLVILGPVAVADLRAQTLPQVFLSDASSNCVAVVSSATSTEFARELHRHCLARGSWSRLLSPWKAYLREHEDLELEEEIPDGVPLVCHPLWVSLAEHLQYKVTLRKLVRRRQHINLLELEAVLLLEARLAERGGDLRYLLGSDSQVTLAALLKGRSSSWSVNRKLRASLCHYLGNGIYSSYGFVPSLSNVADDPTRNQPLRLALEPKPAWLAAALNGSFVEMDAWLAELGYDPLTVAQLPFSVRQKNLQSVLSHVAHLRSVQKPERLAAFDLRERARNFAPGPDVEAPEVLEGTVSPSAEDKPQEESREHKKIKRSLDLQKTDKRGKRNVEEKPNQAVASTHERRVAPPANETVSAPAIPEISQPFTTRASHGRRRRRWNPGIAQLSPSDQQLLERYPGSQFFGPDGKRCDDSFKPTHRGFLDLYSGAAGVARALAKRHGVWVLCFDYEHCSSEDLLDQETQEHILSMIDAGCFYGVGAAPECSSFSRAITPAVRSREFPEGLKNVTSNMKKKIEVGHRHAAFVFRVVGRCKLNFLGYFVDNPDGSFLWLQPSWLASGWALMETSYRFDQCRFAAAWRKRTRLATNLSFAGLRELCQGGHSHITLRGRSSHHRLNWTRVAQVYPRKLCQRIARALGEFAGLKVMDCSRSRLDCASCSRSSSLRIGEATNPGPRRRVLVTRDAADLMDVKLVEPVTARVQERVWCNFEKWLQKTFSLEAVEQMFRSPGLVTMVLQKYDLVLYSEGHAIYEFRHLLVLAQQKMPLIKPSISAAWQLLTKWESFQPLVHRLPLPEILYKAMVSVASMWGWKRWCATLVMVYEGIGRVGEAMRALRRDLVLPSDNFDTEHLVAYMKVTQPKTRRRGRGKVQHLRIDNGAAVDYLEKVFARLHPACKLYPLSAAAFRTRWDKVLDALCVPRNDRPTPSAVRGGGAILAYRRGEPVGNIMWKMRISHQATLEAYLQETVADSLLVRWSDQCRERIRTAAIFFPHSLRSSST